MTKARDIASAIPAPSTVDATELGYLDGVTSAVQTQLDAKTAKSTLTTTGDIYYASAANTPARLAIGSTSNVLTVAGGIPSWAAPAGGAGLTLIDEIPISATTTLNADNIFSSTYKNYRLHFVAKNSADNDLNGVTMKMRASGTSTSAGYESQEIYGEGTSIATRANLAGTDEWYGLMVSGNDRGNNGYSIDLFSPNLASYTAFNAIGIAQIAVAGRPFLGLYGGVLTNTTAYDGMSFITSVNMTGTLFVYGYAKE